MNKLFKLVFVLGLVSVGAGIGLQLNQPDPSILLMVFRAVCGTIIGFTLIRYK